MRTLIIVLTLLFSTLASADTYWVKGDKVKDKDGSEYLIFNDENNVQIGLKVDGLNLVPIDKSKNDSIRKEIKKREEAKKEVKVKKLKNDLNNFINNLLKLSMTLLGILVIILSVGILSMLVWIGFFLYIKLKKL